MKGLGHVLLLIGFVASIQSIQCRGTADLLRKRNAELSDDTVNDKMSYNNTTANTTNRRRKSTDSNNVLLQEFFEAFFQRELQLSTVSPSPSLPFPDPPTTKNPTGTFIKTQNLELKSVPQNL